MFTNTLPTLAQSGYLAKGCKIWLPNLQCIEDSLSDFAGELNPYFVIRREGSAKENPLYRATENVEKELLMCPDALTNETQLRPLLNFSDKPFCVLELRDSVLVAPNTPTRKVAAVVSSSVKKRLTMICFSVPLTPSGVRCLAAQLWAGNCSWHREGCVT